MTKDKGKRTRQLKRRQKVVLTALPPGLIDGLPLEDQHAISIAVGKPMIFEKYERDGTVKLEFTDKDDAFHLIWVDRKFIGRWVASSIQKHSWELKALPHGLRGRREKKRKEKLDRGQRVILKPPTELIRNLPKEDQELISAIAGRPIIFFKRYRVDGTAELEFVDNDNTTHLIYVDPPFIKAW
jgi:hypothetical protein